MIGDYCSRASRRLQGRRKHELRPRRGDYDRFIERLAGPLAERLCDLAQIRAGAHVLDVGCGTGVAARRAAARAGMSGRVIGIDISPGMIEAARRANPHVDLAVMDAEALEFEPSSFDSVISLCAVLHFPSSSAPSPRCTAS